MDGKGDLNLEFVDVYGERFDDEVDLYLRHTTNSHCWQGTGCSTREVVRVPDLDAGRSGMYRMSVYPRRHRPVSRFVRVAEAEDPLRVVLTVDPGKVTQVVFPDYAQLGRELQRALEASTQVEGYAGKKGRELYEAMDGLHKAGLLNIYCKMAHTRLPNQRAAALYIACFRRFRGDRYYACVSPEMREQTAEGVRQKQFHEVSAALHIPPAGFQAAGSYKTFDQFGNLHFTFFSNPSTGEFFLDADVDDAQGIQHMNHLVRYGIADTHPYDIHQILVQHQKLDPGYSLRI